MPTPDLGASSTSTRAAPRFEQMRGILQEYVAILGYWRRGWV